MRLCKQDEVQSSCAFGFTEDTHSPSMYVESIQDFRQRPSDGTCAAKKSRRTCSKPCVWGFDDQTGNFACRDSWWNKCGSDSGTWHYENNAMSGAHCCK